MPTVDITINGRLYGVACDEGQEPRIRDLAAAVDARVRQLTGGRSSTVGEGHVLVLASLMLADELDEAKSTLAAQAEPPGEEDSEEILVAAVDHLAERISSIADRLDRA